MRANQADKIGSDQCRRPSEALIPSATGVPSLHNDYRLFTEVCRCSQVRVHLTALSRLIYRSSDTVGQSLVHDSEEEPPVCNSISGWQSTWFSRRINLIKDHHPFKRAPNSRAYQQTLQIAVGTDFQRGWNTAQTSIPRSTVVMLS